MFKGDVGTVLTFTCKDSEGTAMNFATATSVWLYIDRKDTILKREMTISSATAGITTYTITNEDFTKGDRTYLFQVEVHYGEDDDSPQWNSEIVSEHVYKTLEQKYEEDN